VSDQSPDQPLGEAVPLPEQGSNAPYVPSPEVEALTPKAPETLSPGAADNTVKPSPIDAGNVMDTAAYVPPVASVSVKSDGAGGMIIAPEGGTVGEITLRSIVDPVDSVTSIRQPSRELFKPETNEPPDGALLRQFVTTQRLRDLWHQIDALQEEVIQNVRADRTSTDTYQQDLLYASTLLLQSPANYDEARQIVYRIRGDLNRDRRVLSDTRRYRPLLLVYYGIWLVLLGVLSRLDPQFRQMMPDNLPILKLALPPVLFAALGALFNGVMAIYDHTTIRRDFDPIYISWYVINPLIGAGLGLVVFVFFVVTGTSFTPNLINDQSLANASAPLATWLLAFIVGWQQNTAIRLLNGFLKVVSSGNSGSVGPDRPSTTTDSTTTTPKG
jgi:hypothetical protein